MGGEGRARGVLDFALGGGGGGLGDVGAGQSTSTSRGGGGDRGSGMSVADEEGLGLLQQQLSAVQRIRIEHERKDAAIAALRLEVSVKSGGLECLPSPRATGGVSWEAGGTGHGQRGTGSAREKGRTVS